MKGIWNIVKNNSLQTCFFVCSDLKLFVSDVHLEGRKKHYLLAAIDARFKQLYYYFNATVASGPTSLFPRDIKLQTDVELNDKTLFQR